MGNRIEHRQRGKEEESKEGKYKPKKEIDTEKKIRWLKKERKRRKIERRQQERK